MSSCGRRARQKFVFVRSPVAMTLSLALLVLSCLVEFKPFLVLPSITPIYTHVKLSNKDRHKRTFVYKHTLYKI